MQFSAEIEESKALMINLSYRVSLHASGLEFSETDGQQLSGESRTILAPVPPVAILSGRGKEFSSPKAACSRSEI